MAEALCSEKTARRALVEGPDAIAGCAGERVRQAMERLGLPIATSQESTAAH